MFTLNAAAGVRNINSKVKMAHRDGFEQPAFGDVKASILGQDLDVFHFVVEPAKMRYASLSTDASRAYLLHIHPSLMSPESAENKCAKKDQEGKHGRFTHSHSVALVTQIFWLIWSFITGDAMWKRCYFCVVCLFFTFPGIIGSSLSFV